MSTKKPKFSTTISPVVEAYFAFLTRPSKPYKEDGKPQFKITGIAEDTPETREWIEGLLEKAREEAKEAGIKLPKVIASPFNFPEDHDEDAFVPNADGKTSVDAVYEGKIYFTAKSDYRPGTIDTDREDLPESVYIMSGDKVRIKMIVKPYTNGANKGVALKLKVVQLVEKQAGTGRRANHGEGFDNIEGYKVNKASVAESDDEEDVAEDKDF